MVVAIHERRVEQHGAIWLVFWRDDAGTAYLVTEERAGLCRDVQNPETRWRCIKHVAFAQRKRTEEEG